MKSNTKDKRAGKAKPQKAAIRASKKNTNIPKSPSTDKHLAGIIGALERKIEEAKRKMTALKKKLKGGKKG